jgi:RNA polymerase sigma-70 factor (ECF subfamily)
MGDKSVDQILVERVQQGDKSAFDVLVRKYQHKVAKVIARYIRDQDEVLDVSQEAFIKAYRALPNFRGDSAFYTWLYRIAINTAKNHLVARRRRLPTTDIEIQDAEQFDGASALKDYATPEQLLQRDQVESTVLKAVDQLPDDLRTAITLREIDGMSYEEIAEAMDCPVGTVRSRIFRAREAVDKMLRPVMGSN